MKSATPRQNGPNDYKLGRCVDQCTTDNWLHFQTDGIHIGPTVTSLVSAAMSVLSLLSQCRVSKQSWNVKASTDMPRWHERAQYQQVNAFELGRMVRLQEAGLSYHDTAAHTGHAAMTVMRVWNQLREEGHTQRRAGTGPRNVITARDDRHLVCMAVTNRTPSSMVLCRHWSTATGLDLSVSTLRHHRLRAGLVARMPLHRLPLWQTTNASDCNGHMNAVTGMLSGEM